MTTDATLSDVPSTYKTTRFPGVRWRGDTLYIRFRTAQDDGRGRPVWREERYGAGNPSEAARAQRERQEQEDAIRAGILDRREAAVSQASREPIDQAIDDYISHVARGSRDQNHQRTTRRYLERCVKWCGFRTLADVDAARVARWLSSEFAGKTTHKPTVAVKGLMRWASYTSRIAWNPLDGAIRAKQAPSQTRPSRAMTPDEFSRLLAALPDTRSGRTRRVFYQLAARVGLRWREIAALRWSMVDLEHGAVMLAPGVSKAKRADIVPIPADLVPEVAALRQAGADLGDRVFEHEPRLRTWKRDLQRAKIEPYADHRGQLDRKCLRTSYATWLYEAGVDLRDAQRLMRHRDPKLTAQVYTRIGLDNLHAAQAKVGSPIFHRITATSGNIG